MNNTSDNNKRTSAFKTAAMIVAAALIVVAIFCVVNFPKPAEEAVEPTPTVEPIKMILLGESEIPADTVALCPKNVSFEALKAALEELSALQTLDLRELELTNAEISELSAMLPAVSLAYNVTVLGNTLPSDAKELDLTSISSEKVEETADAMKLLPELEEVILATDDGKAPEIGELPLALNEIAALCQAAPQAAFQCRLRLFGQDISLADSELSYVDKKIGNDGVLTFYELLPCMTKLERLVLDDCKIDNAVMAELRSAFPEINVVWRIHWNYFSALTDAEVIRATDTSTDSSTESLKYCTNARFVDFGHSNKLTDIEWVRYMPKLQGLIIVDSAVSDLSPLAGCKYLEFLEIVNCTNIADLSPLEECTNLRFINFSNAYRIVDISPLYGLSKLERVYASRYRCPEEQVTELQELLPDCLCSFGMPPESQVSCNYSVGWRLDAAPNVRAPWYVELRKIFGIGYDLYDTQGYFSYKNVKPYEYPLDQLEIFTAFDFNE